MNNDTELATDEESHALLMLFRVIAARDQPTISRLLVEAPLLARMALRVGATLGDENPYFFDEIGHFVYAGDTTLHIAAAAYQRDIAKLLVSRGAYVGKKNRRGAEPLHYAADGNPESPTWNPDAQFAIVEYLIKAGADPNSEDKSCVTPLHRAVRTRSTPAVRALLANGADVLRKNKSGSTPLHLAVQNTGRGGTGSATARKEQIEIIRLLQDHGASLSDKNSAGRSVEEYSRSEWLQAALKQF